MIVGGYSLHLYCDREDQTHEYKEFPHEFAGISRTSATRQARSCGWIVKHHTKNREARAVCPKCKKKGFK